jgi:hypothetical protein
MRRADSGSGILQQRKVYDRVELEGGANWREMGHSNAL